MGARTIGESPRAPKAGQEGCEASEIAEGGAEERAIFDGRCLARVGEETVPVPQLSTVALGTTKNYN